MKICTRDKHEGSTLPGVHLLFVEAAIKLLPETCRYVQETFNGQEIVMLFSCNDVVCVDQQYFLSSEPLSSLVVKSVRKSATRQWNLAALRNTESWLAIGDFNHIMHNTNTIYQLLYTFKKW